MADVNISIGAQGDASGIASIKNEYTALGRAKQAYLNIKDKPQAVGARMSSERKMADLERKATDIDRRMMAAKLGMAEGSMAPTAGKEAIKKLEAESLRVNYERSFAREQQQIITQRSQERSKTFAPIVGAGKFAVGKTLKYGAAGAGMLGAYSLISSIMGETGGVDQRNLAYATALSSARGRTGEGSIDYATDKPFFEIQEMLDELGQTAFMTSKEMVPLLDVAKELGDFSKMAAKPITGAANIGKSLGVDPAVLAALLKEGLQKGGFEKGGQYVDISKMMMLNQNMMHRASESLQSMQTVMQGTMHGTSGLGGFGIFNLLDTLNTSQNRAYRGAGGAQAALRIDQAFRGGGTDDAFQYMQTLALNPAFQASNKRRAGRNVSSGPTNWESGYYDQLIADLSQSLGAFATPEDIIKNMKGMGVTGGESYIKKMFGGDGGMKKMNVQRLFDVYGTTYGADKSSGNKFFMQMQMAKSMGVSPADIGVIGQAVNDPKFMERAKKGKLQTGEYAEAYKAYEEGGGGGYEKWFRDRSENQETMISIASDIRTTIDEMKETINNNLKPLMEITKEWLPEVVKTFIRVLGSDEQKKELERKELITSYNKELKGMGLRPGMEGFELAMEDKVSIRTPVGIMRVPESKLPVDMGGTIQPTYTKDQYERMYPPREQIDIPDVLGVNKMLNELLGNVVDAVKETTTAVRETKQPVTLKTGQSYIPSR